MNRLVVSLAVLSFSVAAQAASLPVDYLVEAKPPKEAVAGTSLTLSVFDNAGCTGSPLVIDNQNVEDLVSIEAIKSLTPKGGTKPAKAARLHTNLDVDEGSNLYLLVTGTGVVPSGGACQAQTPVAGARRSSRTIASTDRNAGV